MATGVRVAITLACTECKRRNYQSQKSKRNTPDRVELQNVRPRPAPAVTLQQAMGTSPDDPVVLGCKEVYSFPSAGRYPATTSREAAPAFRARSGTCSSRSRTRWR